MTIKCKDKKWRTFSIVRLLMQPATAEITKAFQTEPVERRRDIYGLQCIDCAAIVQGDLTYAQAMSAKKLYGDELREHTCSRPTI